MTDDIWPSVEEVLIAHAEDDDGYCKNWDCYAHGDLGEIPEGWTHIGQIADVIRWLLRPRPAVMLSHYTVRDDGSTVQNLPANRHQRTNWTGPREVS